MTEHATKLANDHWQYIESLLKVYGSVEYELATAKFHYISAFIHGYKHGQSDSCITRYVSTDVKPLGTVNFNEDSP